MMIFGSVPLAVTALVRFFVATDTPKFLASKGDISGAQELIAYIRSTNEKVPTILWPSKPCEKLHHRTLSPPKKMSGNSTTWKSVLLHPITIPLALVWTIQSTTYWGLTIFLPIVLDGVGVGSNEGLLCMGLSELPGVAIITWISNKYSRVHALFVGFAASVLGAGSTGILSATYSPPIAMLVSVSFFYMALVPLWGVLFVLTPEVYPVPVRGLATGFHHMVKCGPSLFAPFVAASILQAGPQYMFMFIWAALFIVGLGCTFWLRMHIPPC
jgi:putative MFS transporter